MDVEEALKIMGLSGSITHEIIKKKRQVLASKYHPDKNPDGLKVMQDVNCAYDLLASLPTSYFDTIQKNSWEPEEFSMFRSWGLQVTCTAFKTWVEGKTYDHKEILKYYGFRWSPEKRAWWRAN